MQAENIVYDEEDESDDDTTVHERRAEASAQSTEEIRSTLASCSRESEHGNVAEETTSTYGS